MSRKMQEQTMRIMEALSGVDGDLLEQCEKAGKGAVSRRGYGKLFRYGSLCAACLCALLAAGTLRGQFLPEGDAAGGGQQNNATGNPALTSAAGADGGKAETDGASGEFSADREPEWIDLSELSKEAGDYKSEQAERQKLEASVEMAEKAPCKTEADTGSEMKNLAQDLLPEDWQKAYAQSVLGQYVPRELPEGYSRQQALGRTLEDGRENLLLNCSDGEHMLWLNLTETELDPEAEYVCDPPIFGAAEDWQGRIPVPGQDGSRRFAVLYEDGVLAEYAGWLTEEEIGELFGRIGPEGAGQ